MSNIITAALVVAGIGAVCAVVLVIAARFFAVEENEKAAAVRACLPGANCGACGYAGCDGYAAALADGSEERTNLCVPGAGETARNIANTLGVEFEDVASVCATVHCRGDCEHTAKMFEYVGISSCKAAKAFYGGDGKCTFGCIGLGDCASACPQKAICIENGIAHVNTRACIGCGICVRTCPQGLISLMPTASRVAVKCSNTERGALVRAKCTGGCIGCKKCEKSCPNGAITVKDNLARIDYSKCTSCGECARGCPVGCIELSELCGE